MRKGVSTSALFFVARARTTATTTAPATTTATTTNIATEKVELIVLSCTAGLAGTPSAAAIVAKERGDAF